MPLESLNLPVVVYQAEQAQLFQHQHDLVDRAGLLAQALRGEREAEHAQRSVVESEETQNRVIEAREERRRRRRRRVHLEHGREVRAEDGDDFDEADLDDDEEDARGTTPAADVAGKHATPADLQVLNRRGQGEHLDLMV